MDTITKIRNDLASQFRHSGGGYKPEPMLDENGKDMFHPRYGKTFSDESKKLLSEKMTGNTNKAGTKVKDTSNMKKPDVHKGKGNPNWKGGISGKPGSDKRKEYMKKYNKEYFGY